MCIYMVYPAMFVARLIRLVSCAFFGVKDSACHRRMIRVLGVQRLTLARMVGPNWSFLWALFAKLSSFNCCILQAAFCQNFFR